MATTPYAPDTGPAEGSPQGPYAAGQAPPDAAQTLAAAQTARGGDIATPSAAPSTAPQIPTTDANQTIETPDQKLQRESWGNRVYHGVLAALGGQYDTQFIPTANGVVKTQVAQTPGTQWKRIISGAIVGLGGAAAAGTQGPGGIARGLGGGIQAGFNERQREGEQNEKTANTQFDQQQAAAMQKAQRAMMSIDLATKTYNLGRAQVEATVADTERHNLFMDRVAKGGVGTTYLGHFKDHLEAMSHVNDTPGLHDHLANGRVIDIPHVDGNGKIDGIESALVTDSWLDAKTTDDTPITFKLLQDGKLTNVTHTIPAGGATNGEVNDIMNRLSTAQMEDHWKEIEAGLKKTAEEREGKVAVATINKDNADAAQARQNVELMKDKGQKIINDEIYGTGGQAGMMQFQKGWVMPAQQTEQGYQVADKAYQEHKAGQDKTGAGGMLMLSKHLQTTFGSGKGARMNQSMIEDHWHARGVTDEIVGVVQKLKDGDPITDDQWDAFHHFLKENRDAQWDQVRAAADSQGRPAERVPYPADYRAENFDSGTPVGGGAGGGAQQISVDPAKVPVMKTPPPGALAVPHDDGTTYYVTNGKVVGKSK